MTGCAEDGSSRHDVNQCARHFVADRVHDFRVQNGHRGRNRVSQGRILSSQLGNGNRPRSVSGDKVMGDR
jgi:hypothetical protein